MKQTIFLAASVGLVCVAGSQGLAQNRQSMNWLRSPQVQKELEIIDSQMEQIQEIQSGLQKEIQKMYADVRNLPRKEQAEKYRDAQTKMAELYEEANKNLKEVLLPQQVDRLQQIATQMQMRGGAANGLRGELAEKLGLTEEQQKELREKAAEKNKELYQKYAEMRTKMQQELLEEVLSPEQKKQLDDLLGEPVEFNQWYGSAAQSRVGQAVPKKE